MVNVLQQIFAFGCFGFEVRFKTSYQLRHQGCYTEYIVVAAGNPVNENVIIYNPPAVPFTPRIGKLE